MITYRQAEKLGLAPTIIYTCGCRKKFRALNGTYPNCPACGHVWSSCSQTRGCGKFCKAKSKWKAASKKSE